MTGRYDGLWGGIALRGAGLALLLSAGLEGRMVLLLGHAPPTAMQGAGAFLLAMLAYMSASFGAALAILGRHLFARITVSPRWARTMSSTHVVRRRR